MHCRYFQVIQLFRWIIMRGGSGVPCRWLAGRGVVWWAGCRSCRRSVLYGGALRGQWLLPRSSRQGLSLTVRTLPPDSPACHARRDRCNAHLHWGKYGWDYFAKCFDGSKEYPDSW